MVNSDHAYRESLFSRLLNEALILWMRFVSILPFSLIYLISDMMYFLVKYIIRYRRKVILGNLSFAFPEKSANEIKTIADKFYHHFCDLALETIKLHSMSESELDKRVKVKGMEIGNALARQGRSMITLGFHYSNWEWGSYLQTKSEHRLLMIYSTFRGNSSMERYILKSRERWGGKSVSAHKVVRAILDYLKRGELSTIWLASDQTPPANSPFWTYFLNRETPFYLGPEKIAIKTNQPIVFLYMKKTGRGKYEANLEMLFEEPSKLQHKDILLAYIKRMEEIIRETPEYYLWSHRRWKHKRPENIELTV